MLETARIEKGKTKMMKTKNASYAVRCIALTTCLLITNSSLSATEEGFRVKYDGGTISSLKSGADIRIEAAGKTITLYKNSRTLATIPAASVTEISYGQDVHRRVGAAIGLAVFSFGLGALMALSKSKKHFVGLTWADGDAKGGFAMQCDKSDYRGILAALEGVTGKTAVNSEALTVKN